MVTPSDFDERRYLVTTESIDVTDFVTVITLEFFIHFI